MGAVLYGRKEKQEDMSMSERVREESYMLCTSSHPHQLSEVEIPWKHVRCLLMGKQTSQDALLMKINTTYTEHANTWRRMTNMIAEGALIRK